MANNLRVAAGPSRNQLFGVVGDRAAAKLPTVPVHLLRGRAAVVAMHALLVELSSRTGQAGAMDSLEYLVTSPTALDKTPYLVLVGLRAGVPAASATANDVQGAVLLYEYRVGGIRSKVFATDDVTGHRTVIAPAGLRMRVAEIAGRALAQRGAGIALISLEAGPAEEAQERPAISGSRCNLAVRTRVVARDLMLETTLEATLATLGPNTRRNFRRYRLRLEADLGARFVASADIGREQFLEFNRISTNPLRETEAAWRYACLTGSPGMMFAGVQAGDGSWLSLIAGHRDGGVTGIEWQMNRADLPRYSLSTVMRSYLVEHEVRLGTGRIIFKGGTPHSMHRSFIDSTTVDVIVARRCLRAWLLRRLARWIFPKSNFLGRALQDAGLIWNLR